jgi:dTDP-4-dehydrorhamnose reductase
VASAEGAQRLVTRWLVTGGSGQLGSEVVALLRARGTDVVAPSHAELDIADAASVEASFETHRPDVVVSCAAYTAVDAAETDVEGATLLNATAPALLATASGRIGARLLHVSTDYVFAGDGTEPYAEDAPTAPRSVYGATKLAGEEAVHETLPGSGYVVRTAWLYGATGSNCVRTIVRLAEDRDVLEVVDDQLGQPTWAADVADRLVALGSSDAAPGVYHATSSGSTTWFGFARAVFEAYGLDPERIRPTTTDRFPRPAPRPAYSVLGHDRWAAAGLEPIRDWRDAVAAALPLS